jgi:hypothetical protein
MARIELKHEDFRLCPSQRLAALQDLAAIEK